MLRDRKLGGSLTPSPRTNILNSTTSTQANRGPHLHKDIWQTNHIQVSHSTNINNSLELEDQTAVKKTASFLFRFRLPGLKSSGVSGQRLGTLLPEAVRINKPY